MDNQWSNPVNWNNDHLPLPHESVLFDNTFIKEAYSVMLPSSGPAIRIAKAVLRPSAGLTIELSLPASSTLAPAFEITGPGYGLTIERGGIFRNASGAQAGYSVIIADSIRISNGGRYIHNSACSHAANVAVISSIIGTEEGVMEFDCPDASSTLSLSGRIYGKLWLRSAAAGGTVNYTAAGTNPLIINSDLQTEEGVICNLNFADTIHIRRDLLQQGGTLNLGASSREATLAVYRHMQQSPTAIITETGSGKQTILLCGNQEQLINLNGSLLNQVVWVMKGAGCVLQSPLHLPAQLELISGKITSSSSALLTLLPGCSIKADTIEGSGFVSGPMKKLGLVNDYFLFPVGAAGMRWMALHKATGDFLINYHRASPYALSGQMGAGIDHVSKLEYWSLQQVSALPANAQVQLSFDDPNSGGVTSLADLCVASRQNSSWEDGGNTDVTGSPGADGSVTGNIINGISPGTHYFTLASRRPAENPLPLRDIITPQYPRARPARGDFQITLASSIVDQQIILETMAGSAGTINFILYNSAGAFLKTYPVFVPSGKTRLTLDICQFPRGLYYLFGLTSSSRSIIFRFVKR